jgi:hypothetical protein
MNAYTKYKIVRPVQLFDAVFGRGIHPSTTCRQYLMLRYEWSVPDISLIVMVYLQQVSKDHKDMREICTL